MAFRLGSSTALKRPRLTREPSDATFDHADLAFFDEPRSWREINQRFARWKDGELLDAIIAADSDGGAGLLFYRGAPMRAWQLTDLGRELVARGGRR